MSKSKKNKSLKKENRKAISSALVATIANQLTDLGFDIKKINKDVKKVADKLAQKISKYPRKEKTTQVLEIDEAVVVNEEVAPEIEVGKIEKVKKVKK